MKKLVTSVVVFGIVTVLCGCGGGGESAEVDTTQEVAITPPPEPVGGQAAPVPGAPAIPGVPGGAAPPPVPGAPAPMGGMASTGGASGNLEYLLGSFAIGDNGNVITDPLVGLNAAAQAYFNNLDNGDCCNPSRLPELKSLEQLVQYRYIRGIPAAPGGKKYVYDPASMQVKISD